MPTLGAVGEIARAFGKPVLTSNLCLSWALGKRLGITASDAEVKQRILAIPAFQENGHFIGEDRYRVILTTPKVQVDGKTEIKAADLNRRCRVHPSARSYPSKASDVKYLPGLSAT